MIHPFADPETEHIWNAQYSRKLQLEVAHG
jgi:hypothetical protein